MTEDTIYNKLTKQLIQAKDALKTALPFKDNRVIKTLKKKIIALDKKIKKVDRAIGVCTTPGGNYRNAPTL